MNSTTLSRRSGRWGAIRRALSAGRLLRGLSRGSGLALLLFALGCALDKPSVYKISALPPGAAPAASSSPGEASPEVTFEEPGLKVSFALHDYYFAMSLSNLLTEEVSVLWEESTISYFPAEAMPVVDEGTDFAWWSSTSRVLHGGVSLRTQDAPQLPTVVPPRTTLSDILCPENVIHYDAGPYGRGWWYSFIVPTRREKERIVGLVYRITLVLETGGKKSPHEFALRLDDVAPKANVKPPPKSKGQVTRNPRAAETLSPKGSAPTGAEAQ